MYHPASRLIKSRIHAECQDIPIVILEQVRNIYLYTIIHNKKTNEVLLS